MRLYTSPDSPFGARIRIAARAKNIEIPLAPLPPGGLQSAEFLKINPVAKIPVLVTEDGSAIVESEAVLQYLEDRFPEPSLRPEGAEERARLNVAIRIMDAYVMAPVIRLFPHLDAGRRDQRAVREEVGRWRNGMAALAHFMRDEISRSEAGISMADCVLPPSLHLSTRIAFMLGLEEDPVKPHDVLSRYYARMKGHALVGPILAALTAAQAAKDVRAGRPSLAHLH